jgi:hypothetical protein
MIQPWVISISSIVPGLGFLLLGQRRRAVQALASVLAAGLVSYGFSRIAPTQPLRELSWSVLYITWFVQIFNSLSTARLIQMKGENPAAAPVETNPVLESKNLSGKERHVEKVKAYVMQQLTPEEHLVNAIEANLPYWEEKSWGRVENFIHPCYLAITQDSLLVIEVDFEGVPMTVERIPRDHVENVEYKPGLLNDTIILTIRDKGDVKVKVVAPFREQAGDMAEELC